MSFNCLSSRRLTTRRVVACVLMLGSISAVAQVQPDSIETAIKRYKQTGVVSNDLLRDQVGKLVNRREDCSKVLEQIAFDLLTPEQRELLSPGFVNDLPGVGLFRSIKRTVDRAKDGFAEVDVAKMYWNVNRGAAIRYRSEHCGSMTKGATRSSSDVGTTNDGSLASKQVNAGGPARLSVAAAQSSVPASRGKLIVGIDDWEGEIIGEAAPGSKFSPLKIGMKVGDVLAELGQPDDQVFSITAKQLIPVNFGSDKWRLEYHYKGIGRLTFSSAQGAVFTEMHLISIVHDSKEQGKVWN